MADKSEIDKLTAASPTNDAARFNNDGAAAGEQARYDGLAGGDAEVYEQTEDGASTRVRETIKALSSRDAGSPSNPSGEVRRYQGQTSQQIQSSMRDTIAKAFPPADFALMLLKFVGNALLHLFGSVGELIGGVISGAIELGEKAFTWMKEKVGGALSAAGHVIGTVVSAPIKLIGSIVEGPLHGALAVIKDVGSVARKAWNWVLDTGGAIAEWFGDKLNWVKTQITTLAGNAIKWITEHGKPVLDFIAGVGGFIAKTAEGAWKFTTGALKAIGTEISNFAGNAVQWITDHGKPVLDFVAGVGGFIAEGAGKVWGFTAGALEAIGTKAKSIAKTALDWVGAHGKTVTDFIAGVGGLIAKGAGEVWEFTTGALDKIKEKAGEVAKDALDWVRNAATKVWEIIKATPEKLWDIIKAAPQKLWDTLKTGASNLADMLPSGLVKVVTTGGKAALAVGSAVTAAPLALAVGLYKGVTGLAKPVVNGVKAAVTGIVDAGGKLVAGAADKVEDFFGWVGGKISSLWGGNHNNQAAIEAAKKKAEEEANRRRLLHERLVAITEGYNDTIRRLAEENKGLRQNQANTARYIDEVASYGYFVAELPVGYYGHTGEELLPQTIPVDQSGRLVSMPRENGDWLYNTIFWREYADNQNTEGVALHDALSWKNADKQRLGRAIKIPKPGVWQLNGQIVTSMLPDFNAPSSYNHAAGWIWYEDINLRGPAWNAQSPNIRTYNFEWWAYVYLATDYAKHGWSSDGNPPIYGKWLLARETGVYWTTSNRITVPPTITLAISQLIVTPGEAFIEIKCENIVKPGGINHIFPDIPNVDRPPQSTSLLVYGSDFSTRTVRTALMVQNIDTQQYRQDITDLRAQDTEISSSLQTLMNQQAKLVSDLKSSQDKA